MSQRGRSRRRGHKGSSVRRNLLITTAALLTVIAIAAAAVVGWVLDVAADAPPLSSCKRVPKIGNSVVFAANGSRLGYIASSEIRVPVTGRRIPARVKQATIAIEDKRFYEHGGYDPQAIIRAGFEDLESGQPKQGGSTITQQLVRNLCLKNPQDTVKRKIIEAKLASEYLKRHSRKEVLDQYLNIASYGTINGSTAVGIGGAARVYFSRPVWKLDLGQAALLAGLPQAPSQYNPVLNPAAARARRNEVLSAMAEVGYISGAEAREAKSGGLELDPSADYFARHEPFFFDYVQEKLIQHYGVNTVRRGGLRVYTTIEPALQRAGADAISSILYYPDDPRSAIVAIDPRNGEIKSMVSSSSYSDNQYNLATQGHRQAGSTFKAFVLTTAVNRGIDPYSTYYTSKPLELDLPEWGHWSVSTYSGTYGGSMSVHDATLLSDNTVFAQLDLDVGPKQVAATAKKMGITTKLDGIPAEGLGGLRLGVSPLEMANAYATLASGGIHRNPVAIRKVVFPDGRVEHPQQADPKRVLPENVAYEVTRILHDNIVAGTGVSAYTGCAGQAGKTGTTDRYTDAWFMGYQPNLSTGVWVGYPESNAIEMTAVHGITVAGGTFPAEIWHAFYTNAGVPCDDFTVPSQPIQWSSFFGSYTSPEPHSGGISAGSKHGGAGGGGVGGGGGGGGSSAPYYDPSLYAPGAGQQPAPPPSPPPPPSPSPAAGGNLGGGNPTGGVGGN